MTARPADLFVLLALAASPGAAQEPPSDSAAHRNAYADTLTARLITRARARHLRQDSLLHDYRAIVRTRVDAAAGRSRFARLTPLFVHETAARVHWQRPDDLRLEVLGVRGRSAFGGAEAGVLFERPWFVPRALGDSIRLLGIPETAALHPLARGAERYYRYAVRDSLVMHIPGRTVRAIRVEVEPYRSGPSLVAGAMWIDADSGDVVRLAVTFLGEFLWSAPDDTTAADTAAARRDSRRAQRFLTVQADLEYALYENAYWMPHRQVLSLLVEWDILLRGALPVRALTRFEEYAINTDRPITFAVPLDDGDRVRTRCRGCDGERHTRAERRERGFDRAGRTGAGRWEISYPPRDSLNAYEWRDALELDLDPADRERIRETVAELARIGERLPDTWMGRPRHSLQWERMADIVRYNRVQGPSVGLGYEVRPGPAFTTFTASGRFGIADRRLTGRVTWRRDAPGGALTASLYRDVQEAEPWSRGQTLGNSFNTLFTGHDDADYYLAWGGAVGFGGYRGALEDVELQVGVERHRSMDARAGWIGGGVDELRPNPTVAEDDVVRARVTKRVLLAPGEIRVGAEALVGSTFDGVRGWTTARIPFRVARRTGAVSLKTGYLVGDVAPQLAFRAGGPETVRGYPYGFRSGDRFWSAQVDWALVPRWLFSPVLFADAGGTYAADDPLVSVGGGVSLLGGWLRANLAKGLRPSRAVRFDLFFRAPR